MYSKLTYIIAMLMIALSIPAADAARSDRYDIVADAYFTSQKVFEGECVNYVVELQTGDFELNNIYIIEESEVNGLRLIGRKGVDYSYKKTDRRNGKRVLEILFETYVPVSSGSCSIENGKLLVEILIPTTTYHPFWGQIQTYQTRDVEVNIPKTTLNSSKLPKSKESAFYGLVGDFHFAGTSENINVGKNSTFNIVYTIEGSGYVNEGYTPDFKSIIGKGISIRSIYPEKHTYYKGEVLNTKMTYVVSCESTEYGTFTLPPLQLHYFNPATKKYVTINSEEITIEVRPSRSPNDTKGIYV